MSSDDNRLLTVRELKDRLRISLATAYELLKHGKIRSCRIGVNRGAIRVREADVDTYLASCTQQSVAVESHGRPVRVRLKHLTLKPK